MHAHSPHAHRRLRGLSFRQTLLVAFLVIAALLGGAAVQALLALEHVAQKSRDAARDAVRLTESAQRLAERTVAMERSARQFLVLDDGLLRDRYQATWQEARATQDVVAAAMAGRIHNPTLLMGAFAANVARANGWNDLRPADSPWEVHPKVS